MSALVAFFCFFVVHGRVIKHQAALPPRNCVGCEPPGPPAPTAKPKPLTTSAPHFQVEILLPICLDSNVTGVIVGTVQQSLPGADVVFVPCTSGLTKIGIWRSGPQFPDNAAARINGAGAISILRPGETFAMFATADGFNAGIEAAWNQMPHQFDDNFNPVKSGGDITLEYPVITFGPGTSITLTVYGDAPADITFTVTSTDHMSLDSQHHVACTNTDNLSINKPAVDAATVLSFIFAPFLSPWLIDEENKLAAAQNTALPIPDSVKCVLESVIPSVIPVCCNVLLAGKKLDFTYSRLNVDNSGVQVGGNIALVPRVPQVHLFVNCVPSFNRTEIKFTVSSLTQDLLPPLTATWRVDNVVSAPVSLITWKANTHHTISLTVSDVDKLTATANTAVTAVYCPENTNGNGPAQIVCDHKPWLCDPEK